MHDWLLLSHMKMQFLLGPFPTRQVFCSEALVHYKKWCFFTHSMRNLELETLTWTLTWELVLGNLLLGNLYFGSFTWEALLGNLYFGTFTWGPYLGTFAWESLFGNLHLGTFIWDPLLGNLTWEPLFGNLYLETLGESFLELLRSDPNLYYAWKPRSFCCWGNINL